MFSTPDADNDSHDTQNCAETYRGAWWYGGCHESNLNGEYGLDNNKGVVWLTWLGHGKGLKRTEMKIRPVKFPIH